MNLSKHGRRPLARLALAAGGIGALIVVAGFADLAARHFGVLAGAALICAVFAGCGLAFRPRPHHAPHLSRPAPVRLPERARDGTEPVKALS